MSFKLLAIRPLEGCNTKFLKNLKPNQIYQFYNDYKFYTKDDKFDGEVIKIEKLPQSVPDNFYGNNINVSAIVGKNGSGKSSLVELLVASIVKISTTISKEFIKEKELYYKNEVVFNENRLNEILNNFEKKLKKSKNSTLNKSFDDAKDQLRKELIIDIQDKEQSKFDNKVSKFNKSLEDDLCSIEAEFYFEYLRKYNTKTKKITIDNSCQHNFDIRCIKLSGNNVSINNFLLEENFYNSKLEFDIKEFIKEDDSNILELPEQEFLFLNDFFYSLVINYSHFGYNSKEVGEWLRGVFHKNDGYQLPVVINPYREEGNININSEIELAKTRFLVNILQEKELRIVQKNKTIRYISVELNKSKFIFDNSSNSTSDCRIKLTDEEKVKILSFIFDKLSWDKKFDTTNYFYNNALDYILLKLKKMTHYPIYRTFNDCFKESEALINNQKIITFEINNYKKLEEFILIVVFDNSHVTEKFKQALFFIKYCYLNKEYNMSGDLLEIDTLFEILDDKFGRPSFEISKEKFDKIDSQESEPEFRAAESLPSFFKINYYFENEVSENNFNNFSSGEKQKIYSINSVIYHLRNINSVKPSTKINDVHIKLITYRNVNLIFDEIELYAHPEFQKAYVNDFLKAIKVVNSSKNQNLNINILFITHSPFILSDIPKQNILYLKTEKAQIKGKDCQLAIPQNFQNKNSFGANITDLLADSFFMGEKDDIYLMGDFAKGKIEKTLEWLKKEIDKKNSDKENYFEPNESLFNEHETIINIIDEKIIKIKLKEMLNYLKVNSDFETKLKELELKKLADELNYKIEKNDFIS